MDNRTTVHFDRSDDGRRYFAHEDGVPDVTGEGETMAEALVNLRAAQRVRRMGME